MKVGVIGPTNLGMQAQLVGHSIPFLEEKAAEIGKILAELNKELWVNTDGGMLIAIARAYKEHGGRRLVMLLPRRDSNDWHIDHALPFLEEGIHDEAIRTSNWATANRLVVTKPDLVLCVGMSSGTSSELALAAIRWNVPLSAESARPLIAVRELLRERRLIPEHEMVLSEVLQYVDTVEELRAVLQGFQELEPAEAVQA